jgi:hypothetical protein
VSPPLAKTPALLKGLTFRVMVCTPIFSMVVLFRGWKDKGQEQQPLSAPPR